MLTTLIISGIASIFIDRVNFVAIDDC